MSDVKKPLPSDTSLSLQLSDHASEDELEERRFPTQKMNLGQLKTQQHGTNQQNLNSVVMKPNDFPHTLFLLCQKSNSKL